MTCSFHGGAGIFTGGVEPSWEPCPIPMAPDVYLYQGPRPVSTPDAVALYESWKRRNPRRARAFLQSSNSAVLDFVRAGSAQEARRRFDACRRIGIELGDAIGVTARLDAPGELRAGLCKAVGAGSELGVCLLPRDAAAPRIEGTSIEPIQQDRGVAWEE